MFVHPDLHLNVLSQMRIPSGKALFERYGFKAPEGHPDNTDPYKFGKPSNSPVNALERLQSVATRTRYTADLLAKEQSKLLSDVDTSKEEVSAEDERSEDEK